MAGLKLPGGRQTPVDGGLEAGVSPVEGHLHSGGLPAGFRRASGSPPETTYLTGLLCTSVDAR